MSAKDTLFNRKLTINCKGRLLDFSVPKVMGILNVTPDSFYDGNKFNSLAKINDHVKRMIHEGAAIIDIGAFSSRPGAENIDEKEELNRLIPVLENLRIDFPDIFISVDTFRSSIAKTVVEEFNVDIINDISAGELDPKMFDTIAGLEIPYIIMHMKGNPQNMQNSPEYNDLIKEVIDYFTHKTEQLTKLGIKDIIIDPGIGFGKTIEHNYRLMHALPVFSMFKVPVLTGVSRKSLIYKLLNISPGESLNGTTVLHTLALLNKADILRVHDVKEAVEVINIVEKYKQEARNIETE